MSSVLQPCSLAKCAHKGLQAGREREFAPRSRVVVFYRMKV
jgi:hypothetical protein